MSSDAQQSRVDALLRLLGLLVLGFGAAMVYLTQANTSSLASAVITINYALGIMLVVVGVFAAFAKFK